MHSAIWTLGRSDITKVLFQQMFQKPADDVRFPSSEFLQATTRTHRPSLSRATFTSKWESLVPQARRTCKTQACQARLSTVREDHFTKYLHLGVNLKAERKKDGKT